MHDLLHNMETKLNHTPIMNVDEINQFIEQHFPQINDGGQCYYVDSIAPGEAIMRLEPDNRHLRPGNTVSGPTLFALADFAAYVVILAHIGPVALAVTTNLNINFLRKPTLQTLHCRCRIMKLGKRLCVVEADIYPAEDGANGTNSVAHATATYSIPPNNKVT